jgi:hypothetical protein
MRGGRRFREPIHISLIIPYPCHFRLSLPIGAINYLVYTSPSTTTLVQLPLQRLCNALSYDSSCSEFGIDTEDGAEYCKDAVAGY